MASLLLVPRALRSILWIGVITTAELVSLLKMVLFSGGHFAFLEDFFDLTDLVLERALAFLDDFFFDLLLSTLVVLYYSYVVFRFE